MPPPYRIDFDDKEPAIVCASIDEIDAALDRLSVTSEFPILVDVSIPGFILNIGLALDPTFVVINAGDIPDGDYVITIGDDCEEGVVDVYGCGYHTQIERRHLVPYRMARAALRQFIFSETLSDEVHWQDWGGREVNTSPWRRG